MAGLLQSANGKVNRYIISIRDRYLGDFAHHGRAYIGCKSKSCIGLTQSDLLVINKTDLAPAVGADLDVMARDARRMRGEGPVVFAQVKHGVGVDAIAAHVVHAWQHAHGHAH